MIRILIVDDSAFMRKVITDLFNEAKDFQVVGTAKNGKEAVELVEKLSPDLVTMDVEMPVMNGLDALEQIMQKNPVPVVMFSSLTHEGADATIKALSLGAVDFVAKTGGSISSVDGIKNEVLEICRNAAKANLKRFSKLSSYNFLKEKTQVTTVPKNIMTTKVITPLKTGNNKYKIVAIGTSTGGPRALQEIITKLPENYPYPVVIVQHMPVGFTKSLANRLDFISKIRVKEAEQDDKLVPGTVYIAPGGFHMRFLAKTNDVFVNLTKDELVNGHRPAVDPMFESVSTVYGSAVIAVILTGMGGDGAQGMQTIKSKGGYNIAESQNTAVVFGMPKVAIEKGVVDRVVDLGDIAKELISFTI